MFSRRQFLKHAVATGVMAAVAPSLLKTSAQQPIYPRHYEASVSFSAEDIEKTWQEINFGFDEPDLMWLPDVKTYKLLERLFADPRYSKEFSTSA